MQKKRSHADAEISVAARVSVHYDVIGTSVQLEIDWWIDPRAGRRRLTAGSGVSTDRFTPSPTSETDHRARLLVLTACLNELEYSAASVHTLLQIPLRRCGHFLRGRLLAPWRSCVRPRE